jgi:hypothetical protein
MRANAAFPRLVTWHVLEDRDVSNVMLGNPLIQSVAAAAAAGGAEGPVSVAITMGVLAIGTFTYSEMLNRAAAANPTTGDFPRPPPTCSPAGFLSQPAESGGRLVGFGS